MGRIYYSNYRLGLEDLPNHWVRAEPLIILPIKKETAKTSTPWWSGYQPKGRCLGRGWRRSPPDRVAAPSQIDYLFLPRPRSYNRPGLTSMTFPICIHRVPTQAWVAINVNLVGCAQIQCHDPFTSNKPTTYSESMMLKYQKPTDYGYSTKDHGRHNSNESFHPNRKMLVEKIPRDHIPPPQQSSLHMLEEATSAMAYGYPL